MLTLTQGINLKPLLCVVILSLACMVSTVSCYAFKAHRPSKRSSAVDYWRANAVIICHGFDLYTLMGSGLTNPPKVATEDTIESYLTEKSANPKRLCIFKVANGIESNEASMASIKNFAKKLNYNRTMIVVERPAGTDIVEEFQRNDLTTAPLHFSGQTK
jgi:hypothetical protein